MLTHADIFRIFSVFTHLFTFLLLRRTLDARLALRQNRRGVGGLLDLFHWCCVLTLHKMSFA